MSKDIWVEEWEKLSEKLGREPTAAEAQQAYIDRMAAMMDHPEDTAPVPPIETPKKED